ncbi:MAG: glycosyltransferase [Desulfobacteraceae bacterium]|nr:glycosyltransferase [Desulfobacteraceae bacterium]MBC2719639.1 glycosyltransferase [Desulfobacteraceae bacterium]
MKKTATVYQQTRRKHWDGVAREIDSMNSWGNYYHKRIAHVYKFLVAPGQRVIEFGCSTGDLLADLKPALGVGVDFSKEMLRHAYQRHPELNFIQCDIHDLCINNTFDVIILSDLVNDLWDVQTVFRQISRLSSNSTRIILNTYSRVWELPLKLAQRLEIRRPTLTQNWLTIQDITGLLDLADFEVIRHWGEVLWPLHLPLVSSFFNRIVAKIWPFHYFILTNFIIARRRPNSLPINRNTSVSVIVPARNEAGNIDNIFIRVPKMGRRTELVFVEGHSEDNTYEAIEKGMLEHPEQSCKLFRQSGTGKGDAVRLGFDRASGEILMILDADLTVSPEVLPRFYDTLCSGKGEFVNGVRLVYPMEEEAMRYLNLLGNKFFSLAFSWLLGQPIKDTLCGTKVLWKSDYEKIAKNRAYFGEFDPFGDFDLLFGATKLNLKIMEVPIRYGERKYGDTNIQRWKHGLLLLQMVMFALRRIKFV